MIVTALILFGTIVVLPAGLSFLINDEGRSQKKKSAPVKVVEPEPEPKKKESKGRPGVKPDQHMVTLMTNQSTGLTVNDAGISSYDVAVRYYDFIGNDMAAPSVHTEKHLTHKVKLAVGATMKELGWKKKMRGGVNGWHPTDEATPIHAEPAVDPDNIILRKKGYVDAIIDEVDSEESLSVEVDALPRLNKEVDDDLPWPDMDAEFTDGDNTEDVSQESKTEWVKIINLQDGTEDVEEMNVRKDKTMSYVMSPDGTPLFLEWDAIECIWTFTIAASEE